MRAAPVIFSGTESCSDDLELCAFLTIFQKKSSVSAFFDCFIVNAVSETVFKISTFLLMNILFLIHDLFELNGFVVSKEICYRSFTLILRFYSALS